MRFFIRLTWAITCIRTIDALPKPAGAGSNVVPEKHPSPSALQPPSNDHDKNPSGLLVRGQGTALRRPEFSANQNVQIKTKERNMVLSTHDQHSVDISDPSAPGLDRLDDETNFRKSKPPKRRPTGKSIAEVLDAYEINFSQGFDVEPFRWWRNWQFYCRKSLSRLNPGLGRSETVAWCRLKYEDLLNENPAELPVPLADANIPTTAKIHDKIRTLTRANPPSHPTTVHEHHEHISEQESILISLNKHQRKQALKGFSKRTAPPSNGRDQRRPDEYLDLYEAGRWQEAWYPYDSFFWWRDWVHFCTYKLEEEIKGSTTYDERERWCKKEYRRRWNKKDSNTFPAPLHRLPAIEAIRSNRYSDSHPNRPLRLSSSSSSRNFKSPAGSGSL